jgi:hypothetical protein
VSTDARVAEPIGPRVGLAIVAFPAAIFAAGALTAIAFNPRVGLLSCAIVLGWTRLVGL